MMNPKCDGCLTPVFFDGWHLGDDYYTIKIDHAINHKNVGEKALLCKMCRQKYLKDEEIRIEYEKNAMPKSVNVDVPLDMYNRIERMMNHFICSNVSEFIMVFLSSTKYDTMDSAWWHFFYHNYYDQVTSNIIEDKKKELIFDNLTNSDYIPRKNYKSRLGEVIV